MLVYSWAVIWREPLTPSEKKPYEDRGYLMFCSKQTMCIRPFTGNESYTLGQSSKSSIAIQCNHRHSYHYLGGIPCILCTVLQNHDATATSSHFFRSSDLLKKGAKQYLAIAEVIPEAGRHLDTGVHLFWGSGGHRSLTLGRIKPLLHKKWLDWLMLRGRNTLAAMSTQTSNLPED